MILKTGQRVKLTYTQLAGNERTLDAEVKMASPNGRSLVLTFEAMVLGHVGWMPVFQLESGEYRTLMTNEPLKIEVLQ